MEPTSDTSDTSGALALRWAVDLIGLSVTWFVLGPTILAVIGFAWGSYDLGVMALRLSVALGFALLVGAGALLAAVSEPGLARPWLVGGTLVAGVGTLAAVIAPVVTPWLDGAGPLAVLILSVAVALLPIAVVGARGRGWWRTASAVEAVAAAGALVVVAVGPTHLGFRRSRFQTTGFSIRLGGQVWASSSTRGNLVGTSLMVMSATALVLVLAAVVVTRSWAQGQLDTDRPLDPRRAADDGPWPPPPPLPPPPLIATSVQVERPPWDPDRMDRAWADIDPRADQDPLRP